MAIIFAVIGSKDSGKTTTIEYLVSCLAKEGFQVGSVKHIHAPNFSIDTPKKDTFRFAQAGAKVVVSGADREIAFIKRVSEYSRSLQLEEILNFLEKENLDVIFLEGFRSTIAQRKDIFKIITAKDSEDLEKTLKRTAPPILAATGLIANQMSKSQVSNIPIINVLTEGDALLKLVKGVLKKGSH
jgi:molybdopterin-guanine dinucleotide biosynthesis protein B